ncbi:LIM/homeobox protein Awh-like [Oppia nitens]|uniref:LIM/homeobox protein Awh-like n=1 Tax=Oppia nitens TaxID=1686743 RepID=UPI0023DC04A5|nr:LIM/homeobox protein Awh-like [Oppia nitens]
MIRSERFLLKQLSLNTCDTDCASPVSASHSLLSSPNKSPQLSIEKICYGCGSSLATSPIIASVSGHHQWHINCLRCSECDQSLSHCRSCYLKNGRIYCKNDYIKLINQTIKCSKCYRQISPSDWVRRAGPHVYHLACFACDLCQRQLSTGEQFTIDNQTNDSKLLCKLHFGITNEGETQDASVCSDESNSGQTNKSQSKTKRVRTTFTEEQLSVLQANFQLDSNPDGQDLERIAALTGLSKRVTQVWFQNSRARQKKYMNKNRCGNGGTNWSTASDVHPSTNIDTNWSLGDSNASPCSDEHSSPSPPII